MDCGFQYVGYVVSIVPFGPVSIISMKTKKMIIIVIVNSLFCFEGMQIRQWLNLRPAQNRLYDCSSQINIFMEPFPETKDDNNFGSLK